MAIVQQLPLAILIFAAGTVFRGVVTAHQERKQALGRFGMRRSLMPLEADATTLRIGRAD